VQRAHECGGDLCELLGGSHVQIQETAEREVDLGDLVEIEVLVDAAEGF